MPAQKFNRPLPGAKNNTDQLHELIRVDQAGEYGAVRIYKGQLAFTQDPETRRQIEHMLSQEQEHLDQFNEQLIKYRVRPTLLQPLWHVAGFAMGALTALCGKRTAMACTVAVEEVIDEHYASQERWLENQNSHPDLKSLVTKCRLEELEHRDLGLEQEAEKAPFYPLIRNVIKATSKLAIKISKRL